jgi:hypothetical protein
VCKPRHTPIPSGTCGADVAWMSARRSETSMYPRTPVPRRAQPEQREVAPRGAPPQVTAVLGYRMTRNVRRYSSVLTSWIVTVPRAARYLPVPPVMAKEYGFCLNSSVGPYVTRPWDVI